MAKAKKAKRKKQKKQDAQLTLFPESEPVAEPEAPLMRDKKKAPKVNETPWQQSAKDIINRRRRRPYSH